MYVYISEKSVSHDYMSTKYIQTDTNSRLIHVLKYIGSAVQVGNLALKSTNPPHIQDVTTYLSERSIPTCTALPSPRLNPSPLGKQRMTADE